MKLAWICLLLVACSSTRDENRPHVLIETSAGDIEVELYADKAPQSVRAFLSYIDSGFYRNSSFYRVLNDYNQPSDAPRSQVIQGGIWKTNIRKAQQIPGIPHESTKQTGILHKNGVVSLARDKPGSAGTEFFICMGDQPGYDYGGENNPDGQGYAAIGRVINGMNIAWKIYERRADNQDFDPPISIYNIERQ